MNAKKCKKLRREARVATAGLPERRLVVKVKDDIHDSTAFNDPKTTRGVYRKLKRQERRA